MFAICIWVVALGVAFTAGRLVAEDNHRALDDASDEDDYEA